MTDVRVRPAKDADRSALSMLLIEMQRHNQAPHPESAVIETALGSLPAGVEILIAEAADGQLIGLAMFATIYPGPGLSGGFFLKELYVAAGARNSGVGRALMGALARLAVTRGLSRIDWTVAVGNSGARQFYEDLGAAAESERLFYRLRGAALTDLAGCGD